MKYAWFLLANGGAAIVMIELRHSPLAVLDTPSSWIFVAVFNLLRIRNGYGVNLLRVFGGSANLVIMTAEIVCWRMFGSWAFFAGVRVRSETIFSIVQRQES
jgi:hypothetical protein